MTSFILLLMTTLLFFGNETWKKNQEKGTLILPWAVLVLRYVNF